MKQATPPPIAQVEDLRDALKELAGTEVRRLAEASGVPLTTLWNIRTGETREPSLRTALRVWPLIPGVRAARQAA